jgi:hypothetical protein
MHKLFELKGILGIRGFHDCLHYQGKRAVYVDGDRYDVVPKSIFGFNLNGKMYNIYTELSLTPGDSSLVIHTGTSQL